MPLPKLPTRPAAILTFPSGDNARAQARTTKTAAARSNTQAALAEDDEDELLVQPELDGIGAPGRKAQIPARQVPPPPPAAPAPAAPARQAKATPAPARRAKTRAQNAPRKLFVLDTNVLLHDPSSLFRFEEHDIFLPMMTLEELDHQKKGMSEVARNARQVSRSLDALVQDATQLEDGLELAKLGNKDATGRLMFQTTAIHSTLPSDLPMGKADNQILGVVRALQEKYPQREVVLVSKDINMRLKARALGMAAEDYFNDHVLEDSDLMYSGVM